MESIVVLLFRDGKLGYQQATTASICPLNEKSAGMPPGLPGKAKNKKMALQNTSCARQKRITSEFP